MELQIRRVGEGIVAGVAGTAVMTWAQEKLLPKMRLERVPSGYEPKEPRFPDELEAKGEATTEVLARRLVEGVAHRSIGGGKQKKWAGQLVHFGTGAAWGGLFALLPPRRPTLRHGLLFGAVVWALNDNVLVPLLRLGDWAPRYSLGVHLQGLFAHLAYGAGTALALRWERR